MGALESRSADVTISIVSFNSRDFLVDCLRSTYAEHGGLEVEVIVVDNASTDGSAELIRREFPDVTLIVNEENRGFAAAHNQATRLSSGRYLFLLNPDTVLLPGSLTKLASFMDGHPEAGAAAASTWLDHGRTFRGGTHKVFNLPFILLAHTGLAEVFPNNKIFRDGWEIDRMVWQCEDWCEMELLTGECLMVRREVVDEIGLLDERFFMYLEDTDWSLRMRRAGWRLYVCVRAEVIHYVGGSSRNGVRTYEIFVNSLRHYLRKYYGLGGCLLFQVLKVIGFMIAKIVRRWRLMCGAARKERAQTIRITPETNVLVWGRYVGVDSYLVEISDGPSFIRQCGALVKGSRFSIPEEIWRRWPDGAYHWRVVPTAKCLRSGTFRARRFKRCSS